MTTTTETSSQPQSPGRVRAMLRQLGSDYSATVTFIRMTLRARALRRQSGSAQGDLSGVYREAGQRAEQVNAAPGLPAAAVVRDCRGRLDAAGESLKDKERSLRGAEETLAAETARHEGIISALAADHKQLADAAETARDALGRLERQLAQIDRDAQKAQSAIDAAASGKPPAEPVEQLRVRLAALAENRRGIEGGLPQCRSASEQADAIERARQQELTAAKQAWKEARAACTSARDAAEEARASAATTVEAAGQLLTEAHEALGRAIHGSDSAPAELADVLARATQIQGSIGQLDAERTAALGERNAVRREALRFSAVAGGALVAVVLLAGLILVLTRGDQTNAASAPVASAPAASPSAPAAATAAPVVAGAPPLTPALRQALQQTPALSATFFDEQRQQPKFAPTDKLAIEQVSPRPDGTHLLRIAASAETRPDPGAAVIPVTVILEAVVTAEGAVLSSRLLRIDDPEMKELESLLSR